MAILLNDQQGAPLMDVNLSAAMRRWLNVVWGLAIGAVAALIAMALWTYNVADPSFFSATTQPPMNILGAPGAIVADALMRYMGLGSWVIVAILGVWGLRFVFSEGEYRIWARSLLALPTLAFAPVFASMHAVYEGWPLSGSGLGGMMGDTGARMLLDIVPMSDMEALRLVSLVLGLILLVVGGAALGVTSREARQIAQWLSNSLKFVVTKAISWTWQSSRKGVQTATQKVREARMKPRSETMEPAHPTGGWRAKMPSVAGISMSDLPSVKLPKVRREEPELAFDRITGDLPETEGFAPAIEPNRVMRPDAGGSPEAEFAEPAESTEPVEPAEPVVAAAPAEKSGFSLRAVFDRISDSGDMPVPVTGVPVDISDAPMPRGAEIDQFDGSEPPRPPVARETRRVRKSRRAEAERQPALALEDDKPAEFQLPELALLAKAVNINRSHMSDMALEENARMLETVLEDYGVRGEIVAVRPGPVVTLYELEPAPGLKASRVIGLADDIARSMSALAARVSTVPGRSIIGIELPNSDREKVWLRDVFETQDYGDAHFALTLALGKDISGAPIVANLAKMPHLLIAGTTGSGKSVAINTMILSLLYRLSPEQCRMIMIDPKMLELSVYDNIPHLLAPVVTDPKKAVVALKWVVAEMEERYRKMSRMGVRNIDGYNARVRDAIAKGEDFSRTVQTGFEESTGEPVYETETFEPTELPFIVVIVDEMADLMMVAGKEIEACIQRLAQMARASGIHLIMATQRPSVDVITGTIKANFPTRISFQVTSKIDSRTILGEQGAEQLLGMGDMLYMEGGGRIRRVHGPFVSDEEVEEIVQHLKMQGTPDYIGAVTEGIGDEAQVAVDEKLGLGGGNSEDELYDRAVAIVARDRKCSTSYVQRKLAIGYNKAARLVEQMEDQGVVTSANAVGKREILIEER